MRRALALWLQVVISFPLIGAPVLAAASVDAHACCRRTGQHHCSDSESGSGPSVSEAPQCPCPSAAPVSTLDSQSLAPAVAQRVGPPAISQSASIRAFEDPAIVSHRGATHKRGPPSLL